MDSWVASMSAFGHRLTRGRTEKVAPIRRHKYSDNDNANINRKTWPLPNPNYNPNPTYPNKAYWTLYQTILTLTHTGATQLVTPENRLKSCDELTIVYNSIVTTWPCDELTVHFDGCLVWTVFAANFLYNAMQKLWVYFGGASAWKLVKFAVENC